MFYATYSEGFRAGLLNRPGGQGPADGSYVIPYEVKTDEVTNYELGWKTTGLDGRLRFNGSAFFVEVEGLQTTIFDPAIVNLFFSDNAADAEIKGLEGDVTWLPESIDGLTVAGAFSLLDTEITEKLVPTDDVAVGDELAFAPAFQGNLRVRYEWLTESGLNAHIMPQVTFSDKSYSDIIRINRDEIDAWTMVSVRTGIARDDWAAELYVDNLFDKRAEIARNYVNDRTRTTVARPLTVGLRFKQDF
jgi:outer membrane receptor protein involved in Fe transport